MRMEPTKIINPWYHTVQKLVLRICTSALWARFSFINVFLIYRCLAVYPREYWMIYRGTGFLAVVWVGSSPPLPPSASCLFLVCRSRRSSLLTREGGGGRGGANQTNELFAFAQYNILFLVLYVTSKSVFSVRIYCTSVSRTYSLRGETLYFCKKCN